MLKRFEAKGQLLDPENQVKFLANKLHALEWRYKPNKALDEFMYERLDDNSIDWEGAEHKRYLEKAQCLINDSGIGFNEIMTIILVLDGAEV